MNYKEQAGINKKSFELNYNGGTIWREHLDSMGEYEQEVIDKFLEDYNTFCRPSVSSYMIINMDETIITKKIVDCIVDNIVNCKKHFMKVALVGVHKKYHNMFYAIREEGTLMTFLDDYEKAKEWVFLRG